MLRLSLPLASLVVALLAPGCGKPQRTADGQSRQWERPPASDVEAIHELFRKRVATGNAGDVAAWVDLFTDDAVIMPANRSTIRGKSAIREWEQKFADTFSAEGQILPVETVVAGDWAFVRTSSIGTLVPKRGGAAIRIDGKELAVLQRQRDGSWKIARLIGNSNVPPPSREVVVP